MTKALVGLHTHRDQATHRYQDAGVTFADSHLPYSIPEQKTRPDQIQFENILKLTVSRHTERHILLGDREMKQLRI